MSNIRRSFTIEQRRKRPVILPRLLRALGVLSLAGFGYLAFTPPTMLKLWIFGLWGVGLFYVLWVYAAWLEIR